MESTTTIQISSKLKKELNAFKNYPRETYEEVIGQLVLIARKDEESKLQLSAETLRDLREAENDLKAGKVYSASQIRKELGLK
ncbi:MAG: hypothetical protein HY917_00350 [Candidatus Diapherotrites archaeon]|nr:hypothetical protein [Candidatus Diapherotrites archaeon]